MKRLRLRRVRVGCSQVELARRIGKSPAWLSLVERGYLSPSKEMLNKMKIALMGGGWTDGRG